MLHWQRGWLTHESCVLSCPENLPFKKVMAEPSSPAIHCGQPIPFTSADLPLRCGVGHPVFKKTTHKWKIAPFWLKNKSLMSDMHSLQPLPNKWRKWLTGNHQVTALGCCQHTRSQLSKTHQEHRYFSKQHSMLSPVLTERKKKSLLQIRMFLKAKLQKLEEMYLL